MTNEFCREHGHMWETTQLYQPPGCRTQFHLRLNCANCPKVIAGPIDTELDADRTLAEILGEFQDITGL